MQGISHAGDNGKIVVRMSQSCKEWSEPKLVYEDEIYGCRNVHGGAISESEIVIFFNKHDFTVQKPVNVLFMHGKIIGNHIEWSEPIPIQDRSIAYGKISKLADGRLMMEMSRYISLGNWETYLHFSSDNGWHWDDFVRVQGNKDKGYTPDEEIYFLQKEPNIFLGIGRNDAEVLGLPLLLYLSQDNGESWSVYNTSLQLSSFTLVSPWIAQPTKYPSYVHIFYAARSYGYNGVEKGRIYSLLVRLDDILKNPQVILRPTVIFESNTIDMGYPTVIAEGNAFTGIFYSREKEIPPNLFLFSGNYVTK